MHTSTSIKLHGSNGSLPLPKRWLGLFPLSRLHGGPFRHAPLDMAGLCLLEKLPSPGNSKLWRHMPIEDFSVPSDDKIVSEEIKKVFSRLLAGQQVYVGCAGGWGRTGLMLSLIAKVAGQISPVEYVRKNYTHRAVETQEQAAYVADFDVKPLQKWLMLASLKSIWFRFL
jgi:hypothetical protein